MKYHIICILAILLTSPVAAAVNPNYINGTFDISSAPRWHNNIVTIGMSGNYTTYDEQLVRDFIHEWNDIPSGVHVQYHNNAMTSDIRINFLSGDDLQHTPNVPNVPMIAGYAYINWNSNYEVYDGRAYINTDYSSWRLNVIKHELLHTMGLLYHSNLNTSILYPYVSQNMNFSPDDIEAIKTMYRWYY